MCAQAQLCRQKDHALRNICVDSESVRCTFSTSGKSIHVATA